MATLILVSGSGRSGTSLFSGILQRLGYVVPQPEVPADETNPRGFAESQWVVDFHTRLLGRADVQVADARPAAWAATAQAGLDATTRAELRGWLAGQLELSPRLIVKDPRLSWFLPLWRQCAEELGAAPCFVTMLRHPAAVVASKQRWYGGRLGNGARAAGWLNQTLFTERATREGRRALVRYEDLLDDWTQTVDRVAGVLDLDAVRDAPAAALRDVHGFVDRKLSRSQASWDGVAMPAALRGQADALWELICAPDTPELRERLDVARAAYITLYEDAEAIAQSSVAVAERGARRVVRTPVRGGALIRRVPVRYRRRIPASVRSRVVSALASK